MEIIKVNKDNFNEESLDSFDRFQTVENVCRLIDGKLCLKHDPFTETWSAERKREKAREILSGEYTVFCAYENGRVVGELMLVPELDNERMIVDSFHVSRESRRHGIGRALFCAAKEEAKKNGASALYVSACSAEETINFYLAMGCLPTQNPIKSYTEDEPCDIQMECKI